MVHALFVSLALATPVILDVAPDDSRLRYEVIHRLHKVNGVSSAPEGRAVIRPDGTMQVMVRAAIASFDSGDANRDSHMREAVNASQFPHVTFRGITKIEIPTEFPATVEAQVSGQLEFSSGKHRETVPVTLEFQSADTVRVNATFEISLEKYGVERPSLLFVKIDDSCQLHAELTLKSKKPDQAASAGP